MKALVVYSSQTGNTKKLAEALYETLSGEKEIYPVAEAPDPAGYDLVAVGFWFQAGKPDPKSTEYMAKVKNTKVFLFATHGAAAGSDHVKGALEHARGLLADAEVIGSFTCQGEVNPKVLEKVKAKPTPPPWIGDADTAVGHPDQNDLEALQNAFRQAVGI